MSRRKGDYFMDGYGSLTYKPKEAAKVVGVSTPVMYDLRKRADFPAIHIGRAIVIPKATPLCAQNHEKGAVEASPCCSLLT